MKTYEKILDLIPKLHGWADGAKAITLYNLVVAIRPQIVLEIGVWGGRSFFPMAMACQYNGHGVVIGVDPWNADESIKGQRDEDKNWWSSESNHELVYQHFMYYLAQLDLVKISEIHRTSSEEFIPPKGIGVAHIDGNHGPQALRDIQKISGYIDVGGVCILDDLSWSGGYVQEGANYLKSNGFVELHPLGTGAVYCKI